MSSPTFSDPLVAARGRYVLPARLVAAWAGWLAAAVIVGIGLGVHATDPPTPFAVPHAYRLLVGAELFFILVAVPGLCGRGRPVGMLQLALLLVLAAPAVVVAAWLAECTWRSVGASQCYLLVAAAAMAGYARLDRAGRSLPWYWLALGLLAAGAPLLGFLVADLLRAQAGALFACSPFFVADRLSQPWAWEWLWVVPAGALAAIAAGLWVASMRRV